MIVCEGLEEGIPLTPSMLIRGRNLTDLPSHGSHRRDKAKDHAMEEQDNIKPEQRYRMIENIKDAFWRRFLKQYVTELHERQMRQKRHLGHVRIPKVGDMCLLKLEVTPRRRWPLVVVERVDECKRTGKVRTVGIKMYNVEKDTYSHLERSPALLVPLEEDLSD